jgi:hypothetical protein
MILASHGIIASQIASFDADAVAFFARVTAAGGTLSATEKIATNQLVLDLKANSLWTPMKAIYPMVGASAAACAQNLKSSSFTGTFTSNWVFSSNGALPNGTSDFMNTGLNPSTELSVNNFHISYYSRTQNTSFSGGTLGQGVNGGSNNTYIAPYYAAVVNKFFLNGAFPTNAALSSNTTTQGLIVGNKEAINSRKLYLNSTLLTTNSVSQSSPFENFTFYLGALNYSNTASYLTSFQCAFSSIGDGLTDTQESNLYTAVQAMQTTLSRNV